MSVAAIANQIHESELYSKLATYQMLPQFLQEAKVDQAIAPIPCTAAEIATACQQFRAEHQLVEQATYRRWLIDHRLTPEQFEAMTARSLKIQKFKQIQWGHRLSTYFLKQKHQLDQVVYSVLRISNPEVALELYYRIAEGEQTFAELASQYSEGPEAITGGLTGPVELACVPALLANIMFASQPGQLCEPVPLGPWYVIVRLERFIPAQFDEAMRQRLLDDLFAEWLQEQQIDGEFLLIENAVGRGKDEG